jgi:Rrf2 family transcriptional regulator, nitric oxide-sensitive transcriptional repressor
MQPKDIVTVGVLMPCLLRVSEAASLALHGMALMARYPEKQFSNQAMAERLNASSHHLAKVMQMLVKAGLVRSQRGPSGGFRLNTSAEEIQLLRIYEAVDGPISQEECLLHKPKCSGCICMLGNLVSMLQEQIRNCLTNTTLAELSRNLALVNPPAEASVP